MRLISLQSGSNGNCIYVEGDRTRLLFDAGISGKMAEQRLGQTGRDIRAVDAVIISHDHSDHSSRAGVFQRKFGIPLHITGPTLAAANRHDRLGRLTRVHEFSAGDVLQFDGLQVQTVPTPHDGVDGVAFVVTDGRSRLGIFTDLGHVFPGLTRIIASLDALLIESNFDTEMLETGPYPAFLKRRVQGSGGHLSNAETAALLAEAGGERLKWACLGHLSEQNNTASLALATVRASVGEGLTLHLASRYGVSEVLELRG